MSEQYLASENCKLEFQYITRACKLPRIMILVGNTPCQWNKSYAGFIARDTLYYDTTNQPINMSELIKALPSISSLTTVSDPLQALEDDAKGGDAASQFRMGLRFDSNFGSPTADDKLAFEWYLKAAENGHAEAQTRSAVMYENGRGIPESVPKALHWYTQAADNGELEAQFNLAFLYEKRKGLLIPNFVKAKEYYKRAAEAGHTGAKVRLGLIFEQGRPGVDKDEDLAIELFTEAAEKGDILAHDTLGRFYSDKKNFREAMEWSRKAASQNHVRGEHSMAISQSQCRLANLYYLGFGTQQNYRKAFYWYKKASEHDFAFAQYMLGYMYDKGQWVEKNEVDAVAWKNRAKANGYQSIDTQKLTAPNDIAYHCTDRLVEAVQDNAVKPSNKGLDNLGCPPDHVTNAGPRIVAVMGSAGSGKSTLVKQLTKCDDVIIGDNIQTETSEITAYTALIDDVEFQILDTPGFDESGGEGRKFQSDVDVLLEISRYLVFAFGNNVRLSGIIYLHNITIPRVGKSARKIINIFKEICGEDFYTNVAIATTRWDMVQAEVEMKKAVQREGQLIRSTYEPFLARGAEYSRLQATGDEFALLRKLKDKQGLPVKLQEEISNDQKEFGLTRAGLVLRDELFAQKQALDQLTKSMKSTEESVIANMKVMLDSLNAKIQETHQTLGTMKEKMIEEKTRQRDIAETERLVMLRKKQERYREKERQKAEFDHDAALAEQRENAEWASQESLELRQRPSQEVRARERQIRAVITFTMQASPSYDQIYTAPHGGRYYINENGNKTYL
ncbi:hypothetical protein BDR26DRAFT_862238 [Obelidium mucronatum]|nr:hypothetical protein BDR26DRAFT_862238 [Obelidium mucronatum]